MGRRKLNGSDLLGIVLYSIIVGDVVCVHEGNRGSVGLEWRGPDWPQSTNAAAYVEDWKYTVYSRLVVGKGATFGELQGPALCPFRCGSDRLCV